jgi:ribosomal protein S6E (S10)
MMLSTELPNSYLIRAAYKGGSSKSKISSQVDHSELSGFPYILTISGGTEDGGMAMVQPIDVTDYDPNRRVEVG